MDLENALCRATMSILKRKHPKNRDKPIFKLVWEYLQSFILGSRIGEILHVHSELTVLHDGINKKAQKPNTQKNLYTFFGQKNFFFIFQLASG